MRSLRSVALVIVGSAAVLPILASMPAGASTGRSSGSSLMKETLKAVAHEHSVHIAATTKGKAATGKQATVTIVTDAGTAVGIQHITFEQGGRSGHEIVEEVKGIGYLRGDAFTLQSFNGFSKSAAKKYAMKWMSVTKSDSGFVTLTAGVLMSTIPAEIEMPSPKLLAGTYRVAGARVKALRSKVVEGSSTFTGTLFVGATGEPLPVEQKFTSTGGGSVASFNSWNQPVHVKAPRSSVPLP